MKAFKCDVCQKYKNGNSYGTVTFTTGIATPQDFECCKECFDVIREKVKNPSIVNERLVF